MPKKSSQRKKPVNKKPSPSNSPSGGRGKGRIPVAEKVQKGIPLTDDDLNKLRRKEILDAVLPKFKNQPSRTIARYLHGEYPLEFSSVDAARSAVRKAFGLLGETHRESTHDKSLYRKARNAGEFRIPRGKRQVLKQFRVDTPGMWLMCSDWHIPYHDERAVNAMLNHAVNEGCENIYINGDFFDFYKASRWEKDPREPDLFEEIEMGRDILYHLEDLFPGRKVFKMGNHEERWDKLLMSDARAFLGIEEMELRNVLNLKEGGWDYIASKQHARLGKLPILHGHELPRGLTDPVNTARGIFLRTRQSAVAGHWHRSSAHIETSGIDTEVIPCYSIGCLCDLRPAYATINKWNQGFAIISIDENGSWEFRNYVIENGVVYPQ